MATIYLNFRNDLMLRFFLCVFFAPMNLPEMQFCSDFKSPSVVVSSSSLDELTMSVLFSSAVMSASSVANLIEFSSSSLPPVAVVSNSVDPLLIVFDVGIRSSNSGFNCTATKCVQRANSTLQIQAK